MRDAEDAIFPISYSLLGREPEALQPLGLRRTRRRTGAAFSFSPSVGCEDDVALLRFDHLSAYLSDFLHSRVISTACTAHAGDRTVQNLLAEFRSGFDPLLWTPHVHTRRRSRWRSHIRDTRRSFGDRWSSWSAQVVRFPSCPRSLGAPPGRFGIGSSARIETRVAAMAA